MEPSWTSVGRELRLLFEEIAGEPLLSRISLSRPELTAPIESLLLVSWVFTWTAFVGLSSCFTAGSDGSDETVEFWSVLAIDASNKTLLRFVGCETIL